MIIEIDKDGHATYIRLSNKKIKETDSEGSYIIDYADDGTIVGIEYLSIPKIEVDEKQIKV